MRAHRWPTIIALALTGLLTVPSTAQGAAGERDLWYLQDPGVADLHATGVTGSGIHVAVIDQPLLTTRPELAGTTIAPSLAKMCEDADGNIVPNDQFEGAGLGAHGTEMALAIAGTGAGPAGAYGTAPGASVTTYPVALQDSPWPCYVNDTPVYDTIALAIYVAVAEGADIINMSLGGQFAYTEPQALAIEYALSNNVIVVASAGNDGNLWGSGNEWMSDNVSSPADNVGVVAVGALDQDRNPAEFSSLGAGVTVMAPGTGFQGIRDDGSVNPDEQGTSPAAAWTSGVLALAWSAHPQATANQILQALKSTSSGGGVHDPWVGYGRVRPRELVAADPLTFPDENPFVEGKAVVDEGDLHTPVTTAEGIKWTGTRFDPETRMLVSERHGMVADTDLVFITDPRTGCSYDFLDGTLVSSIDGCPATAEEAKEILANGGTLAAAPLASDAPASPFSTNLLLLLALGVVPAIVGVIIVVVMRRRAAARAAEAHAPSQAFDVPWGAPGAHAWQQPSARMADRRGEQSPAPRAAFGWGQPSPQQSHGADTEWQAAQPYPGSTPYPTQHASFPTQPTYPSQQQQQPTEQAYPSQPAPFPTHPYPTGQPYPNQQPLG